MTTDIQSVLSLYEEFKKSPSIIDSEAIGLTVACMLNRIHYELKAANEREAERDLRVRAAEEKLRTASYTETNVLRTKK